LDAAVDLAERAMSIRRPPGSAHAVLKGPQNWPTEADGAVERNGALAAWRSLDLAVTRSINSVPTAQHRRNSQVRQPVPP
jgi:hypothetical protein